MPFCVRGHIVTVEAHAFATLFSHTPLPPSARAGGQTVIDAATASLGLDLAELDPTVRALKRYGNQSSASFLFAFDEMLDAPSNAIVPNDCGAFVTMGPGAGIEFALWTAGSRAAMEAPRRWLPGDMDGFGCSHARPTLVHRVDVDQ